MPDFQHWPPWRPLVVATAAELTRYTGQHLIAVQTVLDRDYLAGIFTGLRAVGLSVFHVLLDAREDSLRLRIEASGEARQWRLDHLPSYHLARPWLCGEAGLVVDTTALTTVQAAHEIASALPDLGTTHPRPGPTLPAA